jgi:hypothetical protein
VVTESSERHLATASDAQQAVQVATEQPILASAEAEDAAVQVATEPPAVADREPQSRHEPELVRDAAREPEAPIDVHHFRKAARVSVVPSLIEPGLFLVRLLDEDSAPPSNAAEALLVLIDPDSQAFTRSPGQYLDRNH